MAAKPDGGLAFPQAIIDNHGRIDFAAEQGYGGMTLRDYFAAAALTGIYANTCMQWSNDTLVSTAFLVADKMLEAR